MKITHTIYPIKRSDCWVELPSDVATALQLGPGMTLYAVLARKSATYELGTLQASQTFLATTTPKNYWGRLVRVGVILPPTRGSLAVFVQAMAALGLFVRHEENIEGTPTGGHGAVPNLFCVLDIDADTRGEAAESLRKLVADSAAIGASEVCTILNRELTKSIATLWAGNEYSRFGSCPTGKGGIEVAWVSALTALNAFRNADGWPDRDHEGRPTVYKLTVQSTHPRRHDQSSRPPLSQEEALIRFPGRPHVVEDWQDLGISLIPLRRLIDPFASMVIDASHHLGDGNLAALLSVDHDERLVRFDFIPLKHLVLADFSLLFPSSRQGYQWLLWAAREIREAGGTILGSRSTGRHTERWTTLHVSAAFEFTDPPTKADSERAHELNTNAIRAEHRPSLLKIARIVQCFRALKGKELYARRTRQSPYFRWLARNMRKSSNEAPSDKPDESLLYDVKLRYSWTGHPGHNYRSKYAAPSFNFSKPLTLHSHGQLFPQLSLTDDSRLRLATRIHERLTSGHEGSIVIVGAHRSGKTSLLNMIADLVNGNLTEELTTDSELCQTLHTGTVCLRINAAVTPPQEIFLQILKSALDELQHLLRRKAAMRPEDPRHSIAERKFATLKGLLNAVEEFMQRVIQGEALMDIEGVLTLAELVQVLLPNAVKHAHPQESSKPLKAKKADARRSLIQSLYKRLKDQARRRSANQSDIDRARELRNSLEILLGAVKLMPRPEGCLRSDEPVLIVAVDEIMETTAWGGDWALPAWRRVIEAPEFRSIRWLFASSRPVSSATPYSPLSNALREYNLGPLTELEANLMIEELDAAESLRALYSPRLRGNVKALEEKLEGKLRPTVTFNARQYIHAVTGGFPFLLQVTCTHVYEQSVCYHVPVISTRLVRRILKRRVLPDLSDFFSSQWKHLQADSPELASELLELAGTVPDLLNSIESLFDQPTPRVSRSLRKSLARLGLGARSIQLFAVPLFLMWIQDLRRRTSDVSS